MYIDLSLQNLWEYWYYVLRHTGAQLLLIDSAR